MALALALHVVALTPSLVWSPTEIDHRPWADTLPAIYSGSIRLVESFGLFPHLYAEDTQIYGFCRPGATDSLRNRIADCDAAVADWMHIQVGSTVVWVSLSTVSYPPTRWLLAAICCRLSAACVISVPVSTPT